MYALKRSTSRLKVQVLSSLKYKETYWFKIAFIWQTAKIRNVDVTFWFLSYFIHYKLVLRGRYLLWKELDHSGLIQKHLTASKQSAKIVSINIFFIRVDIPISDSHLVMIELPLLQRTFWFIY